jgi:hypothetical protein
MTPDTVSGLLLLCFMLLSVFAFSCDNEDT